MGAFSVVGINDGHAASAAIVVDGVVSAAVAEEPLVRRKHACGHPRAAIESCLATAGLDGGDVSIAVVAGRLVHPLWHALQREERFSVGEHLREQRLYWSALPAHDDDTWRAVLESYVETVRDEDERDDLGVALEQWRGSSMREAIADYANVRRQLVAAQLGIPLERVLLADHHRAHAAYAYFAGHQREQVLVATMDASGDGTTATLSLGNGPALTEVSRTRSSDVGRLYRAVTLALGMRPDAHEYKVMGLAPYSTETEEARARRALGDLFQNVTDFCSFSYPTRPVAFERLGSEMLRRAEGQRFDGLAGAIQAYTEQIVLTWLEDAARALLSPDIAFSGGVAQNVKVNGRLARSEALRGLFVPPGPGDESLAVGAAFLGAEELRKAAGLPPDLIQPLADAYLGPAAAPGHVARVLTDLRAEGFLIRPADPDLVAAALELGHVVGRCSGRLEFGPRALGNRSILMDAGDSQNVAILNRRVKQRDFWMPFAPVMLAEDVPRYLEHPPADPRFMTVACSTTSTARVEAAAALHPYDGTARPQVVDTKAAPELAAVLAAFRRRTGRGALVNTSLNLHGQPIAAFSNDAADLLRFGALDVLVLEDKIVTRTGESSRE